MLHFHAVAARTIPDCYCITGSGVQYSPFGVSGPSCEAQSLTSFARQRSCLATVLNPFIVSKVVYAWYVRVSGIPYAFMMHFVMA
jgi:hypothetical protein